MGCAVEDWEWDGLRMPGRVVEITQAQSSEEPMRNLYRRWAQFMEADSWAELATWRRQSSEGSRGRRTGTLKRGTTLTRLAALATLSRSAGEGGPSPPGLVGEGRATARIRVGHYAPIRQ